MPKQKSHKKAVAVAKTLPAGTAVAEKEENKKKKAKVVVKGTTPPIPAPKKSTKKAETGGWQRLPGEDDMTFAARVAAGGEAEKRALQEKLTTLEKSTKEESSSMPTPSGGARTGSPRCRSFRFQRTFSSS